MGDGKPKNNQKLMKIIFKPEWKIRVRKNEKEEFLKHEIAYKIIDLLKDNDAVKAICLKYSITIRIALRPKKLKQKT